MKKSWAVLILVFTLLLLSFSFSQSHVARQQSVQLKRDATKIERFLKFLETAKSLTDVKAELVRANFTHAELDQLKSDPQASLRYKQSMDRIVTQTKSTLRPKLEMARQRMAAAANEARMGQLVGGARKGAPGVIRPPVACPPPGPLKITKIIEPLHPGRDFEISGTGFGDKQGTVRVALPAALKNLEQPVISSWKDCSVIARLSADIPKLDAPNTTLFLTTSDGRRTSRPIMVKPEMVFVNLSDGGMCIGPGALWPLAPVDPNDVTTCDKTCFDFALINDYYVYKVDFQAVPMTGDTSAAMELLSSPPLNTPNCSARTAVKVRMPPYCAGAWALSVVLAGPRGLPYKK